jgi:outer membrane protein OmpA-like peptidoglycan-associated protein
MKNKMYVRQSALVAGLCGLVASLAVVGAPAAQVGASTATNGPIFFNNGTGGIEAVNPDGSSATVPTFIKGSPSFSSTGALVTWTEMGESGSGPVNQLMMANADGTDKKVLASSATLNDSFLGPQFSADGSKIVFFTRTNSTTSIVEVNTTDVNQTPTTVVAAGGQATNITGMSVSVNGDIAFIANGCGGTAGVYVRRADGNYTNTTSPIANSCVGPAGSTQKTAGSVIWNSDGTKLFVLRKDFGAGNAAILTADPVTGITTAPILTIDSSGDRLALAPDGTKIAFSEWSGSTLRISVMNIDGTNKVGPWTLTGQGSYISPIAWGFPIGSSGGNTSTPSSGGSATTTVPATTVPANGGADSAVVPGVTVTDTKVYTRAPRQVAASSAITVLTRAQTRTRTIESNTPSVCLPTNDDIVFIDEGRCSVSILSKKTGRVLKRLSTRVIEDEVSDLEVGNEIAVIAPIYFDGASNDVNARGLRRIRGLVPRISAAGTVLVIGHSGIALGDTPENRALSRQRAVSTVNAIKKAGGKGPFNILGVGGKSPLVASTRGEDQAKNRRVVIVLVP